MIGFHLSIDVNVISDNIGVDQQALYNEQSWLRVSERIGEPQGQNYGIENEESELNDESVLQVL